MPRFVPPARPTSAALLALAAACAHAPAAAQEHPVSAVVAAERAFAAASLEVGVREAFLRFAADDAVIFQPDPVSAKETWRARPSPPIVLTWVPEVARAAASGDLGFTTGPYELRDTARAGEAPRHGHYVTVWRREPAGWRFVVDIGGPHPAPETPAAPWSPGAGDRAVPAWREYVPRADPRHLLRGIDAGFGRVASARGFAAALERYAVDDVRLHRAGVLPAAGKAAATALAAREARRYEAEPIDAGVSRAGDFGYVYGRYRRTDTAGNGRHESGHYLRIWVREPRGTWRLLLDVTSARPPEREE